MSEQDKISVNSKVKYMVMGISVKDGKRKSFTFLWLSKRIAISEYKRLKGLKSFNHVEIFRCEKMDVIL